MPLSAATAEALDSVDAVIRDHAPAEPFCRELIPDEWAVCSELGAELLLDEPPDAPALPEPTLAARRGAFVKALVDGEPAVATLAAAGRAGFDQLELASDALEIMRRNRAFWLARQARPKIVR